MKNYLSLGDYSKVENLAVSLATNEDAYVSARIDAYSLLATHHILIEYNPAKSLDAAKKAYELSKTVPDVTLLNKNMILNNIAFSLLENDDISTAKKYINRLNFELQNNEYAYATLGLFYIKSGSYTKGEEAYAKAISCTDIKGRKQLLSQKLNYELGRYWYQNGNLKNALKYLNKSIKHKQVSDNWNIDLICNQAKELINNIKHIK